jgi:acyl-CoA dehydrogenase
VGRRLFTGNPDWSKLLGYAPATLTAEEQAFLNGPVDALCAMLDEWKINWELRDLPKRSGTSSSGKNSSA